MNLAVRTPNPPEIPWWVYAGLGLAAGLGAAWLLKKPSVERAQSWTPQQWPDAPVASVVAVGQPSEPEVAQWLEKMRAAYRRAGIDTSLIDPVEVNTMHGTPTKAVAIPDPSYWPRQIQTLVLVVQPARQLGYKVIFRDGFRPESYNKVLAEAEPGSRHMWAEAVDFYTDTAAGRRAIALFLANMYLKRGDEYQMGVGIYGTNTPSFHVDTGFKKRDWADTLYWIKQLQAAA